MLNHPTSLSATLDSVAEAFFNHQPIPPALNAEITSLVVSRQQKSGTNAGFFIPYAAEVGDTGVLFSGEKLRTTFATNHIRMLEAARLLKLLSGENYATGHALQLVSTRMSKMCYYNFCSKGECKALTIACLRYRVVEDTENATSWINDHLARLATHRDGKGKWGSFPFYFTLLLLTELPDPLSVQELQYAAPACEKLIHSRWNDDPISHRRQKILLKALERS